MSTTLLPAIRSYVGDWIYYVTTLTFDEVRRLIKDPDEIHERKRLSDWIQREVVKDHSEAIASYITENEQRFLGSLIIGIHEGNPDWAPLSVNFSHDVLDLDEEDKVKIEGKLGLLHLSGNEKLFAIDGQHRVAGIKKAFQFIDFDPKMKDESISAIFVAHDASSEETKQRTRRLFTTVNKKAKRVSKTAIIALDEDNGFAVVTRMLIDKHWLFEDDRKHISYTSSAGSIPPNDKTALTSVVGLYEIVKDLYSSNGRKKFEEKRPSDSQLDAHLKVCISFLDGLLKNLNEFKEAFIDKEKFVSYYRDDVNNHMLFRPIGQRVFAKATQLLVSRGLTIENAIKTLVEPNLYIESSNWNFILWNPTDRTMITNKLIIAETQLLTLAGQPPRDKKSLEKLKELQHAYAS